jgi:hypothetical protein
MIFTAVVSLFSLIYILLCKLNSQQNPIKNRQMILKNELFLLMIVMKSLRIIIHILLKDWWTKWCKLRRRWWWNWSYRRKWTNIKRLNFSFLFFCLFWYRCVLFSPFFLIVVVQVFLNYFYHSLSISFCFPLFRVFVCDLFLFFWSCVCPQ